MKKILRLFILLVLFQSSFYANDLASWYPGQLKNNKNNYWYPVHLIFKTDSYDIFYASAERVDLFDFPLDKLKEGNYEEKGTFYRKEENGLESMYFSSDSGFTLMDKCGILNYGKLLYLIKGRNVLIDSFWVDRDPPTYPYMNEYTINSSSFLTEKDTKYDGSTFYYNNHDLTPWVEGVKGDGKGEWVEMDFSATHDPYCPNCIVDAFLFSNGYVNYDKPYLYKANNRVKTLRVICEERDIDICVELDDTSKFQLITLPKNLGNEPCKVRFVIEDVYKGNKWDDTVINRIIPISKDYIDFPK